MTTAKVFADIATDILAVSREEIVMDSHYVKVRNVLIAPIYLYQMRPHHPQYDRSKPLYVDELLHCLAVELGRSIDGYSLTTINTVYDEPIYKDRDYEEEHDDSPSQT